MAMDALMVAVPGLFADDLVEKGLATKRADQRGTAEVVSLVVAVVGFAADSATLIVSVAAIGDLWRALVSRLRREPRATKLRITIEDHVDISLDLDWLGRRPEVAEAVGLRVIAGVLTSIAEQA